MPKRTKAKEHDPATGRFVKRRTDDSSRQQQSAQEAEEAEEADRRAQYEAINAEYNAEWQERNQENNERMAVLDSEIYDNDDDSDEQRQHVVDRDEQRQPVVDPDEAGPSQPAHRRMINLARLQGRNMEQMDARHQLEVDRLAQLTAELAETQERPRASLEACPPSSRRESEEDDHNPDAEAFVDAEMTDAEMNHAYEQHVPIPSVDQPRLIRSSVHFQSMRAAAPVADRPELVRS